jgi:hypothetical protein
MQKKTKIYKYFDGEEYWESPSLAWIHRIRREMAEGTRKPLSKKEVAKLVKKYNLKVLPEAPTSTEKAT